MGLLSRFSPSRNRKEKEAKSPEEQDGASEQSGSRSRSFSWFGLRKRTTSRDGSEESEEEYSEPSQSQPAPSPPSPPPPQNKKADKKKASKDSDQQLQELQQRVNILTQQVQELEEYKQKLGQQSKATQDWQQRYNMQQFKVNLMVDMFIMKMLEAESAPPAKSHLTQAQKVARGNLNSSNSSNAQSLSRSMGRGQYNRREQPPEMIESYDDY